MATINARIDDKLKQEADEVLKLLGISQTEAISALYQYIAENTELPFIISTEVKTKADILKEISYVFSEARALLTELHSWTVRPDGIVKVALIKKYRQLHTMYHLAKEKIKKLDNHSAREPLIVLTAFSRAIQALVKNESLLTEVGTVYWSEHEQTQLSYCIRDLAGKMTWLGIPEQDM